VAALEGELARLTQQALAGRGGDVADGVADDVSGGDIPREDLVPSYELIEARRVADALEQELDELHTAWGKERTEADAALLEAREAAQRSEEDLADMAQAVAGRGGGLGPAHVQEHVEALKRCSLLEGRLGSQEESLVQAGDTLEKMGYECAAKDDDIQGLRHQLALLQQVNSRYYVITM